jgi:predicted ester cyclase
MCTRSRSTALALLAAVTTWPACASINSAAANKALVRGYMEEILNRGDLSAADRYFPREGYVLNGTRLDTAHLRMMREGLLAAFPDFHLTIEDQIAEGDKVVTRVTFRGTHLGEYRGIAPTGRQVVYGGIAVDRIADGRVVEGWHQADQLGLLRQLGATVAPAAQPRP